MQGAAGLEISSLYAVRMLLLLLQGVRRHRPSGLLRTHRKSLAIAESGCVLHFALLSLHPLARIRMVEAAGKSRPAA